MATQKGGTPRETGKGRAARVPLDYYKSPDGLLKAKLVLTAVAVLAAVGWLAWGVFARPDGGRTRFARGPVATVHAPTENDCKSCHVAFSPMSEQNLFMRHPSAADKNCLACHAADEHHKNQKPESVVSCAGCHREHRGRDVSLVMLPDSDCTVCHRDLKDHLKTGETTVFANAVPSFASHPEFGTYSKGVKDPGALKFNHQLHLALGKPGGLMPGTKPLDCQSCHVPQPGEFGATTTGGRYMQPVNFDTQCKSCHPLTFDPAVKADGAPMALPHRLKLTEVRDRLDAEYHRAVARNPADFLAASRLPGWRPLPGKAPGADSSSPNPTDLAEGALRYLKTKAGCAECHTFAGNEVVPVNVPDVWFKHARFNHAAHKATACTDCHGAANTSTVNTDVLLPDVKTCQGCHGPKRADNPQSGVRHECTTCHTYHHGDAGK